MQEKHFDQLYGDSSLSLQDAQPRMRNLEKRIEKSFVDLPELIKSSVAAPKSDDLGKMRQYIADCKSRNMSKHQIRIAVAEKFNVGIVKSWDELLSK